MPVWQIRTLSALHRLLRHEMTGGFLQAFGPIFNAEMPHSEAVAWAVQ